jgi:hypothetical protein
MLKTATFGLGLTIAALLACGGSPSWTYNRLIRDPVEGDLVSVSCDGKQTVCYEGAARACPRGFDVADSGGQSKTKVIAVPNTYNKTTTVVTKHDYDGTLLVRCKPKAAAVAGQ